MADLNGWDVILGLKIAVSAVTVLLLSSLLALLAGRIRLHGRINLVFFILTVVALLVLELLVRVINPRVFDYFDDELRSRLSVHLYFALPSACLMPVMLYTGYTHRRWLHLRLAILFGILWTGTVVTGIFSLPHHAP
jgi:hypothetical protein